MVFHLRNIQNNELTLVPSGSFSIGREDDNFLFIDHGSVSRYHAVIINSGEEIFIEDTGSSNGTALRGELVTERTKAMPGDVVYFGSIPFRIESPEAEEEPQAQAPAAIRRRSGLHKATDLVPLEEIGRKLKESVKLPDFSKAAPGEGFPPLPTSNPESEPIPAQPPLDTQSVGGSANKLKMDTGEIRDLGDKLRSGAAPGSRRHQEAEGGDETNGTEESSSYGKSTRASGPMPETPSGHKPWMHVYGTTSSKPRANSSTTQPMDQPHTAAVTNETQVEAPPKSGPSMMLIVILAVGFGFSIGIVVGLLMVIGGS